jgi:integrase
MNKTKAKNQTKKRTGYIFKRGGIYWLRYTIAGKRIAQSLETTTERDAEQAAEKIMAPLKATDTAESLKVMHHRLTDAFATAERLTDEATPPLAILKAWDLYLASETRPRSGDETLRQYEYHFDAFTRWLATKHPEAVTLRDVTPEMAAGFIRHLETERHLSGNRINKHVQLLRLFFKVLSKSARIHANPFADISPRRHLAQSKQPLTIAQLRDVILKAEGELKTFFMLGAFTGLRFADAALLKWSEVDIHRRIIRRIPRKTARSGKAVIIGLPADFAAHLDTLERHGPYVQPGIAEEYESNAPGLSRRIQAHFGKCGIETTLPGTGVEIIIDENGKRKRKNTGKRAVVLVGFHSLRHSFVSLLAQAGTPQAILQKLAGHSNPMMTEHYTHLSDESALAMATTFPKLLAQADDKSQAVGANPEPIPGWAVERLKEMTGKNWNKIRNELTKAAK